jgi:hypothetical protein
MPRVAGAAGMRDETEAETEERRKLRRIGGVMLESRRTGEPIYVERPIVMKLLGLACLYAMLACLGGVVAGLVGWWDPSFEYSVGIVGPALGAVAFGGVTWSLRSRR